MAFIFWRFLQMFGYTWISIIEFTEKILYHQIIDYPHTFNRFTWQYDCKYLQCDWIWMLIYLFTFDYFDSADWIQLNHFHTMGNRDFFWGIQLFSTSIGIEMGSHQSSKSKKSVCIMMTYVVKLIFIWHFFWTSNFFNSKIIHSL